ncbi:oligo-1,6-glucosidase [Alkalispirochaeta americana]|uniref:Oligo-1,6-glucosidase n=1 Tax=Alkalispirochaeta americana TaxID=159291 RepID=A0A1N6S314_9SPIO|nr:alpha-glucosidase [Alkalispirochaeta americana]SIQ35459.1 oligo-1,6-glucosidase [Alkalispirochaeta americana]
MNGQSWWQDGAIYHIYPRSFHDTNGDGLGDLRGITEKLPYLQDLGVDAIWMGPVFLSPQVDNGYDISDYCDIDPLFGTLADMDELIEAAQGRGIRVLLDLVFNHTSDLHPWFVSSRDDPRGPHGDWYIWRDAPPEGGLPNNWRGFFSLPAWTWCPRRGQYYLHLFAAQQPDLNWENPAVREALAGVARFWLDRGVDGFRMDVINLISKRQGLPSIPPGESPAGYFIDGPRVLPWLQEFRRDLSRERKNHEELLLVGETPGISPEAARAYTGGGPEGPALDMVLLFDHLAVDHGPGGRWDPRPLRISALRQVTARWQGELQEPSWPSLYLSNHDQPRVVSRFGDPREYRYESATALATAFYLQRGTPVIYQGDEIAMANYPLASPGELQDIESINALEALCAGGMARDAAFERIRHEARDNGRTPFQWSSEEQAGFSRGEPWFPLNPDYPRWNARAQAGEGAPGSVLAFFRRLLALRKGHEVLRRGGFSLVPVDEESPLFGFCRDLTPWRDLGGEIAQAGEGPERAYIWVNLSGSEERLPSGAGGDLVGEETALALSNYSAPGETGLLRPWEARVYLRTHRGGAS